MVLTSPIVKLARRAAVAFARQHLCCELVLTEVTVHHLPDGKPELQINDPLAHEAFQGIDLSLADSAGVSVALVGTAPVGMDIEPIEARDVETWRGLLGADGYALALNLAAEVAELLDCAATRVWTVLEAGKKANSLKRFLPTFESRMNDPWISLVGRTDVGLLRFLSTAISGLESPGGNVAILTVAVASGDAAVAKAAI